MARGDSQNPRTICERKPKVSNKPVVSIDCVHKTQKDDKGYPRRLKVAAMWRSEDRDKNPIPGQYKAGKAFFEVYDRETGETIPAFLKLADGRTIKGDDWYLNMTNWSEKHHAQDNPPPPPSMGDLGFPGPGYEGGAGFGEDDGIPF